MIKSIKMLQPVLIEYDDGNSKVFFLDPSDQKLLDLSSQIAPEEESIAVVSDIDRQILESIQEIPSEIYKAINTEKQLVEDSDKHIFRRS